MSWLFGDGMGHYSAIANVTKKWTTLYNGALGLWAHGAYGRFGRNGLAIGPSASAVAYIGKTLAPTDVDTAHVGVALKIVDGLCDGSPWMVIGLLDGGTYQCGVQVNLDGTLSVVRSTNVVLATSANAVSINTWYYLELSVTIDDANGAYRVRVNGVDWIGPTSGANTQASANASWNQVRLHGQTVSTLRQAQPYAAHYCDFYICDGAGARLNDLLGDLRGDAHYVTGVGNAAGWTPLSGANWQMVDEQGGDDGDTSYNSTTTANALDSFPVDHLKNPGAQAIHAVQVLVAAKQPTAGMSRIRGVARASGADYLSAAEFAPSADSYAWHNAIFEQNPSGTPAPWTEAAFNDAEFGYKKTG